MLAHLYSALIGLIGLLFLYAGLFLTETEEGSLQNRLEELWVRVDDLQSKAMKRQAALLQQVSLLSADGITKIFGQNLFSLRSIASCLCFTLASTNLSLALWVPNPLFPRRATLPVGVFYGLLGFSQKLRYVGAGLFVLSVAVAIFKIGPAPYQVSVGDAVLYTIGYLLGVLIVIGCVALTRWSLDLASKTSNPSTMIAVVLAFIILAASLVGPILLGEFGPGITLLRPATVMINRLPHEDFVFSVLGTTLFACALALAVVLVVLAALLHRIFWPVISRTIYAAHRHGLVQPKWFRKLGIACLILGWPNNIVVKGVVKFLQSVGLSG